MRHIFPQTPKRPTKFSNNQFGMYIIPHWLQLVYMYRFRQIFIPNWLELFQQERFHLTVLLSVIMCTKCYFGTRIFKILSVGEYTPSPYKKILMATLLGFIISLFCTLFIEKKKKICIIFSLSPKMFLFFRLYAFHHFHKLYQV